eukprot:760719-Rhodomonas_salina.1
MLRAALLALLYVASCCAFQAPLLQGGSLALRGPQEHRIVQYRGADELHRDEIKKLFIAKSATLPAEVPEIRRRVWEVPSLALHAPITLEPEQLTTQISTRALGSLAVLVAGLSLFRSIPGGGNVLAHFAAGAAGGIAALCVTRPGEAMVNGPLAEKIAATGVVKGVSAGCYSALMTVLQAFTAGASCAGLTGVALASLGTGLVVGLCAKGLERAEAVGEGVSLLKKLKAKASNGFFTQDGLFGKSMGGDLASCVVQYEAFFLSYALLCMAFPWMGASFAGTAVSGGISGVISMASGAAYKCMSNVSEFSRQCKDWWCGPTKTTSATAVADECASTAVKSAVLFVAYKAAFDAIMMAA